jgi:hypothetical protein
MWAFGQGTIAENTPPFSARSGQGATTSKFWHCDRTPVSRARLEDRLSQAQIAMKSIREIR